MQDDAILRTLGRKWRRERFVRAWPTIALVVLIAVSGWLTYPMRSYEVMRAGALGSPLVVALGAVFASAITPRRWAGYVYRGLGVEAVMVGVVGLVLLSESTVAALAAFMLSLGQAGAMIWLNHIAARRASDEQFRTELTEQRQR